MNHFRPIRTRNVRLLVALGVAATVFAVLIRGPLPRRFFTPSYSGHNIERLEREVQLEDARCSSLAQALQDAQQTSGQDKVRVFYELREVEMEDQEAWQKATDKVESDLRAASNALVTARAQLIRKEEELDAARRERERHR